MNDEPIPLITYVLVTITSFVLAYASIDNDDVLPSSVELDLDNTSFEQQDIQKNTEQLSSPIDIQPSLPSPPSQPDIPIVNAVPIESETKYGGQKKKNKIQKKKIE